MTCDEARPLLSARLDKETDRPQNAALDSHLAACLACSGELERLQDLQDVIRGELPYNKAPAHLRDQVKFALRGAAVLDRPAPKPRWKLWASVAAALFLIALPSAMFLENQRSQRRMVADEFLSAHARALMSRDVDVVSSDNHTVKPWFNGKLSFSPPVVDLASEGFPLEGGRLDYIAGNPVAALVYRRRLHRIDVFVQPATGKAAPAHYERNGFTELSWTKGDFLFTAVSDLSAAEMTTLQGLLMTK